MITIPIKIKIINHNHNLFNILNKYSQHLIEKSVLIITSKIISICQGSYINKSDIDKYELVKKEADLFLEEKQNNYDTYITIKDGLIMPSAGIDESNSDNSYILYPRDLWETAEQIWNHLRNKEKITNLGVIITDSRTNIMRRGVTGVALAWCGFNPLYSYIGKLDLYGEPLKITQINVVDSLATAGVFVMGEGAEQTPMAVITDIPHITFSSKPPSDYEKNSVKVDLEKDLYASLLMSGNWIKTK